MNNIESTKQTSYGVQCNGYNNALQLMSALRKAGIECGESTGCVAIYCAHGQEDEMQQICQATTGNLPIKHLVTPLEKAILAKCDLIEQERATRPWSDR